MSCAEALAKPRPEAPPAKPVVLVVAVALVDRDGRILIAQRPPGKSMAGLWEFPGGKVGEGETPEFALMRELEEELGIETRPTCYLPAAFASHSYGDFHLLMPLYVCRAWKGIAKPKEHTALKWVKLDELSQYPMPEADIPLIATLRQVL